MRQVGLDGIPFGVPGQFMQKPAAHIDQRSGAVLGHVKAAEKLLARRLDHVLQPDKIGRRGVLAVCFSGSADFLGIGRELFQQQVEESVDFRPFEGSIGEQQ